MKIKWVLLLFLFTFTNITMSSSTELVKKCPDISPRTILQNLDKENLIISGIRWHLKLQNEDIDKAGKLVNVKEFLKTDISAIEIIHSGTAYNEDAIDECIYLIRSTDFMSYFALYDPISK